MKIKVTFENKSHMMSAIFDMFSKNFSYCLSEIISEPAGEFTVILERKMSAVDIAKDGSPRFPIINAKGDN